MTGKSIEVDNNSVVMNLQVKTQANRPKLEVWPDSIDFYVTAPPVKGKANREIIEVLSDILQISSSQIELIRGHRTNIKMIRIFHIQREEILQKFSTDQRVQMKL